MLLHQCCSRSYKHSALSLERGNPGRIREVVTPPLEILRNISSEGLIASIVLTYGVISPLISFVSSIPKSSGSELTPAWECYCQLSLMKKSYHIHESWRNVSSTSINDSCLLRMIHIVTNLFDDSLRE